MADTSTAWYPTVMRDRVDRRSPPSGAAVYVLMYRYLGGIHGRGGSRELLDRLGSIRLDVEALRARLLPGRYRLEWRSARGRVLRVKLLVVRGAARPPYDDGRRQQPRTPWVSRQDDP